MIYQNVKYDLSDIFKGKSLRLSHNLSEDSVIKLVELTKFYHTENKKIRAYIIKNDLSEDDLLCSLDNCNHFKGFDSYSKGFNLYCSNKCRGLCNKKLKKDNFENNKTRKKYNELNFNKLRNYEKEYKKTYMKAGGRGRQLEDNAHRKRRAKKRNVDEIFNLNDREYTFTLFDNKCFNCNSQNRLEIDHHMPLSKGFGLTRKNAVVLCRSCNAKKHNKEPKNFYNDLQIKLLEEKYNIGNI